MEAQRFMAGKKTGLFQKLIFNKMHWRRYLIKCIPFILEGKSLSQNPWASNWVYGGEHNNKIKTEKKWLLQPICTYKSHRCLLTSQNNLYKQGKVVIGIGPSWDLKWISIQGQSDLIPLIIYLSIFKRGQYLCVALWGWNEIICVKCLVQCLE